MRITSLNIKEYLEKTYKITSKHCSRKQLDEFVPLLQKNYGEDNDCTLTSMTAIIFFLSSQKLNIQEVYDCVEKTAKKYGYKGDRGTPALTIRKIFHVSLAHFNLPKAHGRMVKNVGFNFDTIKNEINKGNPLILSMFKDGQNYYENHSVTIVGYEIYKGANMLIIYDNWYRSFAYVDYKKMSNISSVHYTDLTFKQKNNMWKQLKTSK